MPHSVRSRSQPGNRSGRSCFWAGDRIPAVIADRIRAAVDDFAVVPPHDDVAVLVLAARPRDAYFR